MPSSETIDAIVKSFSVLFMGTNFLRLLGGLWVTVWIAPVSVFFSMVLGFLFGIVMTRKNRIIKVLSRIYLEIMRIMPQMVLLFVFYYGATYSAKFHTIPAPFPSCAGSARAAPGTNPG